MFYMQAFLIYKQFQSTRSHGARPNNSRKIGGFHFGFNPRARTERDMSQAFLSTWVISFNPRARTERDVCALFCSCGFLVSIHALARSATKRKDKRGRWFHVSIHALARSATCSCKTKIDFNKVSIHALARSATRRASLTVHQYTPFQSTRSHGARHHRGRQETKPQFVSIHALARSATQGQVV